jgi:hypothetical protein
MIILPQTGGMRFIGTFLRMLQSGFSPQQHPLLEIILRQKEKALERAKAQVHVRGCWSARGHPEPHGEDASLELKGNEVFLMVPSDGEEINHGNHAVTFVPHPFFLSIVERQQYTKNAHIFNHIFNNLLARISGSPSMKRIIVQTNA